AASRIRIGRLGIQRSASIRKGSSRWIQPPEYPAAKPAKTPIRVEKKATLSPRSREFCSAQVSSQKMSCPRLVVPSRCDQLAGWLRGTLYQVSGLLGANQGMTTPSTSKIPKRVRPRPRRKEPIFGILNLRMNLPVPNARIEQGIHQVDQERGSRHRHNGQADRTHQKVIVALDNSGV